MHLFYDIMDIRVIYVLVCAHILGCGHNRYTGMCMLQDYRGVLLTLTLVHHRDSWAPLPVKKIVFWDVYGSPRCGIVWQAIYDQLAKGLAIMSVTFAVFVHGPWWVFFSTIKQYAKSWFRWMSNRPLFIGLWKKKNKI